MGSGRCGKLQRAIAREDGNSERGFGRASEGLRGAPRGRSRGGRFEEIQGEICGGHYWRRWRYFRTINALKSAFNSLNGFLLTFFTNFM